MKYNAKNSEEQKYKIFISTKGNHTLPNYIISIALASPKKRLVPTI